MISSLQLTHFTSQPDLAYGEENWIEAAKTGDLEAFNNLVLKYQDGLYRIACAMLRDEESAADALQDGFISAFQHLASFRSGSFKGWLIRIVVNKCGDRLRSAHHRRAVSFSVLTSNFRDDDRASDFEVQDAGPSVERRVEYSELEHMIAASLNELPEHFRAIVILADMEELDYKDIARILNVPIGTVKSRLARARMQLRGLLVQQGASLLDPYACSTAK
jgi:RNA polymerase sigma-70 factor, ECF subfamily